MFEHLSFRLLSSEIYLMKLYFIYEYMIFYQITYIILSFRKMDKNYYDILGLKREASQNEVADAYRRLALVWHPKYSKQDATTAEHHFSQICEAYDVLSDPIKRAYYDKHGWRSLCSQLYHEGSLKSGYKFGNNSYQIFDNFFSSTQALNCILDRKINNKGSMFSHAFGGLYYQDNKILSDLIVQVPCTLDQLYKGAAKVVYYSKNILNPDGRSLSRRQQKKLLQIKPGYGNKTVLRFKQQGNQTIQKKISDLVFKIVQIKSQLYSRNGDDLIYTAKISLAKALSCQSLQIITLDMRKLRISLDQIPNPQTLKEIENEGMPITDSKNKGNLYIKFDIFFPKVLGEEIKAQLRKLL